VTDKELLARWKDAVEEEEAKMKTFFDDRAEFLKNHSGKAFMKRFDDMIGHRDRARARVDEIERRLG
jgi:hypothetical protein